MSSDFKKVLHVAHDKGIGSPVIFSETITKLRFHLVERRCQVSQVISTGTSLSGIVNGREVEYTSNSLDPDKLIQRLNGKTVANQTKPVSGNSKPSDQTEISSLVAALKEKLRVSEQAVQERNTSLHKPQLIYEEWERQYDVVSENTPEVRGKESSTNWWTQWQVKQENENIRIEGQSEESILKSRRRLLEACSEVETSFRMMDSQETWPAPAGNYPILWSEKALAKLCFEFLKSFRADCVLGQNSFLNNTDLVLPQTFSILETPVDPQWDHEGTERKTLRVLDRGNPRGLACDKKTAATMDVAPTGHGRRGSYREAPVPGFWSPELIGHKAGENLLSNITGGLSVRDLSVLQSNPKVAAVEIKVEDARLIHRGSEGEPITPFVWKLNLLKLLGSLEGFTRKSLPIGIPSHGAWLTSMRCPKALSHSVCPPGSVPESNYW